MEPNRKPNHWTGTGLYGGIFFFGILPWLIGWMFG